MKIQKQSGTNAILLGNGINNYSNIGNSWIDLLLSIAEGALERDSLSKKEITYPEFYDAVSFNNGKGTKDYKTIKKQICVEIGKMQGMIAHSTLNNFARENNLPIITTNYDMALIDDSIKQYHQSHKSKVKSVKVFPQRTKSTSFTDYYPWDSYYSDHKVENVTNEFAIWHAHGMQCYERSISIGAIDYGNNISRYKRYIPKKDINNDCNWIGRNTWLEIFFKCNLYIIGLALESQETSIRWLLMEREKYFRRFESLRKKTTYVVNDEHDNMSKGKEFLFKSLSISIVHLKNGNEIYQDWKMR